MVTLENIEQHTIPFDQFELKWRFTEEKYNVLPASHLEQIQPLDKVASKFLNDLTMGLFDRRQVLGPSFFEYREATHVPDYVLPETEEYIKKWLYHRGLPFEQQVFASWDPNVGAITNWKMVVKYWSDFWYPSSDDLVVVDKTLSWALVIYHYDYIEFGTNIERRKETSEGADVGTATF